MTTEISAKLFPYEQPPPEMVKKYYEEYGMTPDSIKEDIATLKEWMAKQPHLPSITDDRVFERFLYFCKNSLEKTKGKLDAYYSTRAANPDYFHNRDPLDTEIKESAKAMFFCVLPKLTKDGDRVTIFKIFDPDVSKFNPTVSFKTGFMSVDAHLPEDKCRSHVLVYDMQGGSLGHVGSLTIPVLKKFFNYGLVGMPLRHSSFHIVNAPSFAESLITLGKSFLKDKIAKRVYVHSNVAGLHNFIPKENLPSDYGGTYSKTMAEIRDISFNAIVEHREWFKNEEKLVADETKRIAKQQSMDHVEGSFRKINID